MLNELKKASNMTRTENGAAAYRSTGSCCLDFFASCGAMRNADEDEILRKFIRAYAEDADIAMRLLFYARDVRGGLGERRLFRVILRYLADHAPKSVVCNIHLISEYGRYDDLLVLLGTECEDFMAKLVDAVLDYDRKAMSRRLPATLLAKWLPSVNTSSPETRAAAQKLCSLLGLREADYRKRLSALRAYIGTVEDSMRRGDYSFDYSAVPSKAMLKYRAAFLRNDPERYNAYLSAVESGDEKINSSVLYPYEIVDTACNERDGDKIRVLDGLWKALPDYTDGRNALAVVDGSGSMYMNMGNVPPPIMIAVSLGMYFAERNRGEFANHFITFSDTPRLVEIKGKNVKERAEYCMSYNEISSTDLCAVFELILKTAISNRLPQSELPELLYIISDMEFNRGVECDDVIFEQIKSRYKRYGYKLPQIVYWNVCARREQFPVKSDDQGVALVSGSSPSIFSLMMSGEVDPYRMMLNVVNSARYRSVCA